MRPALPGDRQSQREEQTERGETTTLDVAGYRLTIRDGRIIRKEPITDLSITSRLSDWARTFLFGGM